MSQIQTIKTAIHEITHADLHNDNSLEHPLLKDGQKLLLSEANELFEKLEERQRSDREKENYQGLWY